MFVYSSNIEVFELPFCVHLSAVYFLLNLTLKVYPIECCLITGFFRFSALSLLPCVQMSIKKPLFPEYSKQPQGERHLQLSLFFFKQDSCFHFTCFFQCPSAVFTNKSGLVYFYHFSYLFGRTSRVYKLPYCRKYKFIPLSQFIKCYDNLLFICFQHDS